MTEIQLIKRNAQWIVYNRNKYVIGHVCNELKNECDFVTIFSLLNTPLN